MESLKQCSPVMAQHLVMLPAQARLGMSPGAADFCCLFVKGAERLLLSRVPVSSLFKKPKEIFVSLLCNKKKT